MSRDREVKVVVLGEDRSGSKALKGLGDEAERTEKRTDKAFKGIALAIGGSLISDQMGGLLTELGDLGVGLDIMARKSKTVFEGSAADIDKWADKNAHAMGLTDQQLVGLAANFGDLVKPMGFAASEAADMSKEVIGLSGVLSAWSGGQRTATDVADILTKAMLGERDGLKALGISISEADVKAKLALKGQQDLTGAALQQATAVATQELIFEKSADAQKAWADGSLDAAKKSNQLKAVIAEVREEIASRFGPALTYAGTALQTIGPIASGLGGIVQATGMSLGDLASKAGGVGAKLGLAGAAVGTFVYALGQMDEGVELSSGQLVKLSRLATDEMVDAFESMSSKGAKWGFDMGSIFRDLAETSYGAAQRLIEGLEAQENKTDEQTAVLAAYKKILDEVGAANVQAGEDAEVHAGGEEELTDTLEDAKRAADDFKSSLDRLLGVHITVLQETISYESKVRDLQAAIDDGTASLDWHTDAGEKTVSMITDLISDAGKLSESMLVEGASTEEANAAFRAHVAQLDAMLGALGPLPPELQAIIDRLHTLANQADITQRINIVTTYTQVGTGRQYGPGMSGVQVAQGGIIRYYAGGGVEDHVAQIAPRGVTRIWNEPETDGEAYIPYALAKRDRSARILATVASDFGYHLTPRVRNYATGGPVRSASGGSSAEVARIQVQLVVDGKMLAEVVRDHDLVNARRGRGIAS